MFKLGKRYLARTFAFGLILAVAGFCYATSTADSRATGESAGERVVGSNTLHFTNALLLPPVPLPGVNTFDLGDACLGSQIVRYLSAGGGLRPYQFNVSIPDPSGFPIFINHAARPVTAFPDTFSTLELTHGGRLQGSLDRRTNGVALPYTFQFQGAVTDEAQLTPANNALGLFQINFVDCPVQMFRFALDKINNGVLGQSYLSKLETLGGNHTVTYSVLPNTLAVDGAPKGNAGGLEAIGLSLATDGTITGRPLQTGHVTFVARAVDSINRIALDRTNTIQDQLISFDIETSTITSTDFTTTAINVKGTIGQFNKDSIRINGYFSPGVAGVLDGARFVFTIGGASYEGRIATQHQSKANPNPSAPPPAVQPPQVLGKLVNERGGPLVFQDGSRMTGKINNNTGQFSATLTKASLAKKLDAVNILDRSTRRYAVGLVTEGVNASDVLDFSTKRSGDKFQLDYNLGKIGTSLGGAFQMISVQGNDKVTVSGSEGVQWAVKFIAVPRFGIDTAAGLDSLSSVRVRIGARFSQLLTKLTSSPKGDTVFSSDLQGQTVSKFQLSSRTYRGQLLTQPLLGSGISGTGIGAASDPKSAATVFTLGIDLDRSGGNADFTGEAAIPIHRTGPHGKKNSKSLSIFHGWSNTAR